MAEMPPGTLRAVLPTPSRQRRRRWVPALVLAASVAMVSCGAEPQEQAETGPAAADPTPTEAPEGLPPQEDSTEPPEDERPVPRELRFTAPQLGGGSIRGAEYAGRDVAVWFWAPW